MHWLMMGDRRCVCACVRVCVHVRMRVRVRVCVRVRVHVGDRRCAYLCCVCSMYTRVELLCKNVSCAILRGHSGQAGERSRVRTQARKCAHAQNLHLRAHALIPTPSVRIHTHTHNNHTGAVGEGAACKTFCQKMRWGRRQTYQEFEPREEARKRCGCKLISHRELKIHLIRSCSLKANLHVMAQLEAKTFITPSEEDTQIMAENNDLARRVTVDAVG
jgi:hypothetical protein